MQREFGIHEELEVGRILSEMFDLFRADFGRYFVLFAVTEGVVSAATLAAERAYGASLAFALVATGLLALVLGSVAQGTAIRMASDKIQTGRTDLGQAVRFAFSRLIRIWIVSFVVGVVVLLGVIALVVPGIILAIMFSMALPALLLENRTLGGSLNRSRELVSHRWGKTFVTFIVVGLVVLVASVVVDTIAAAFGFVGPVVTGLLSGFYQPLLPIVVTVYYYSNAARLGPHPAQPSEPIIQPPPPVDLATTGRPGAKFCFHCGAQMNSSAVFCPKCGMRQPA